jgi:plasmid stabilization system protein ParE
MRGVYTDEALADIDDILLWLAGNYPAVAPLVSRRIESVVARIARWPQSARVVPSRPGVRAVPLGSYPYVIFYRVTADAVEILHVHHAARMQPENDEQA